MCKIKKLGLGGATFGSVSGLSYSSSVELLELAYDNGVRFYDTANIYGQGDSERAIGHLFNKYSDCVFGTKAGYSMPSAGSSKGSVIKKIARYVLKKFPMFKKNLMKMRSNTVSAQDFSYETISIAIDASLARLQVEKIPIFMLHSPRKLNFEDENFCLVLENLKQEGKIEQSGLALMAVEDILEIKRLDLLDVVQVELNLLSPREHFEILKNLKEKHGVKIVVRQPFAGGKLINNSELLTEKHKELNLLAQELDIPIAELALSALADFSFIDRVLVGTTKKVHLLENIKYMNYELTELIRTRVTKIIGI